MRPIELRIPRDRCLDPIFGEPACGDFWTSSEDSHDPSRAWIVDIDDDGFPETREKNVALGVRAVRSDRSEVEPAR